MKFKTKKISKFLLPLAGLSLPVVALISCGTQAETSAPAPTANAVTTEQLTTAKTEIINKLEEQKTSTTTDINSTKESLTKFQKNVENHLTDSLKITLVKQLTTVNFLLEKVKELSDQIHIVSKELLSKDFEDQSKSQDQMKKQELDKSEQEVVKALTEQKTEIESQIKENKELIQKLSEIKDDTFLNTTTGLTFVSSLENKILELQDLKRDLENTFKKSVAFHNSVEQAKFIKEKQADKKKIDFIIRDLFI